MRHLVVLVAAIVAAAGAGAGTAAPRAEQVPVALDDVAVDEGLSEACGFEVTVSVVGDLRVTLIRNQQGLIVREIDSTGGTLVTFASESGSFSFHASPAQWDYGSGAVVGSTAVASFPGLQGHIPGVIDSDAGLVRLTGTVVAIDDSEFGIPVPAVDFESGELLLDVGNRNGEEEVAAAVCGALSST